MNDQKKKKRSWKMQNGNYLIEAESGFHVFDDQKKWIRSYLNSGSSDQEVLSFINYEIRKLTLILIYQEKVDEEIHPPKETIIATDLVLCGENEPAFLDETDELIKKSCEDKQKEFENSEKRNKQEILYFINSLPDPSSIQELKLLWDTIQEKGTAWPVSVIKDVSSGSILWQARSYYGEKSRFQEIEELLKAKYGEKLYFAVNRDNDLCCEYFHG